MPTLRRSLMSLAAVLAGMGTCSGQTPPSNAVGDCSLVVDPTALRLCVESARQARPASTFDPAGRPQAGTRTIPGDLASRPRKGARPDRPASPPTADPQEAERSWRLRIP